MAQIWLINREHDLAYLSLEDFQDQITKMIMINMSGTFGTASKTWSELILAMAVAFKLVAQQCCLVQSCLHGVPALIVDFLHLNLNPSSTLLVAPSCRLAYYDTHVIASSAQVQKRRASISPRSAW